MLQAFKKKLSAQSLKYMPFFSKYFATSSHRSSQRKAKRKMLKGTLTIPFKEFSHSQAYKSCPEGAFIVQSSMRDISVEIYRSRGFLPLR